MQPKFFFHFYHLYFTAATHTLHRNILIPIQYRISRKNVPFTGAKQAGFGHRPPKSKTDRQNTDRSVQLQVCAPVKTHRRSKRILLLLKQIFKIGKLCLQNIAYSSYGLLFLLLKLLKTVSLLLQRQLALFYHSFCIRFGFFDYFFSEI